MTRFIHPYNFVRLPNSLPESQDDSAKLFQRSAAATHDRFNSDKKSGYIECELTTHTHWFIPHAEKIPAEKQHKSLGYFTLDSVNTWDKDRPQDDTTVPAIPGSSLRGMIRSVFETVTLSCLGEFDPGMLDFRVAQMLDSVDSQEQLDRSGGVPDFIPVRIHQDDDGNFLAELLDGRAPDDDGPTIGIEPTAVFPYANVNCYDPAVDGKVWNSGEGKRVASTVPRDSALLTRVNAGNIKLGDPVAIVVQRTKQTRNLKSSPAAQLAFRSVEEIVPATDYASLAPAPGRVVMFGYWYRTGPNFMTKHDERVFFSWDAEYNLPPDPKPNVDLEERFQLFKSSYETKDGKALEGQIVRPIGFDVIEAAQLSFLGYNNRHLKNAGGNPPRSLNGTKNQASDFIDKNRSRERIKAGNLFYALIEGMDTDSSTIRGLYPVAVPRLNHPNSRGELLWEHHRHFYPCKRIQDQCGDYKQVGRRIKVCDSCKKRHGKLCPACRVFGWVREFGIHKPEEGASDRIDAVAGHVRFSHGTLVGGFDPKKTTKITLPILDSPKPTFTGIYLKEAGNDPAGKKRWPPMLQKRDKVPERLYRNEEAELSGRKQYRRSDRLDIESNESEKRGLKGTPGKQNQTVHLLPDGMTFSFRVYFDNLSDAELGALVYSLNLQSPDCWPRTEGNNPIRHMLGHGKPLGMGACSIKIQSLQVHGDTSRYETFAGFDESDPDSTETKTELTNARTAFAHAWSTVINNQKSPYYEMLRDMIDMMTVIPVAGDAPIHYPTACEDGVPKLKNRHNKIYTWFVAYKENQNRIPLPEPHLERTDPNKRLSVDPRDTP